MLTACRGRGAVDLPEQVRAARTPAAIMNRERGAALYDAGIRDPYRAAQPDGVFCYTFFKGVAAKPAHLPREGSNGRDV